MTLEEVWQILEDGRWASKRTLKEACGLDEGTTDQIIKFLNRWAFIEVQSSPELRLRRRTGVISPLETFDLLSMINQNPSIMHHKIAERVACRVCSGTKLDFIGANEVECGQCNERQWDAIESRDVGIRPAK